MSVQERIRRLKEGYLVAAVFMACVAIAVPLMERSPGIALSVVGMALLGWIVSERFVVPSERRRVLAWMPGDPRPDAWDWATRLAVVAGVATPLITRGLLGPDAIPVTAAAVCGFLASMMCALWRETRHLERESRERALPGSGGDRPSSSKRKRRRG